MSDVASAIERYVAVWNEPDAAQRQALIAEAWSEDATYRDPLLEGDGHEGLSAMFAAVNAQLPGHRLRLAGPLDSHHDRVRFAWELVGPDGGEPTFAGIDFGVLAEDGRLRAITGFVDRAPGMAADG